MKLQLLRTKQELFLKGFNNGAITTIEKKLERFHAQFPIDKIVHLNLDDYIYGKFPINGVYTFCYWMEKELSDFGRIAGSPCSQYGVWYGTHGSDKAVKYRHTNKYGNSVADSLEHITQLIRQLHDFGASADYERIGNCRIANKFKGKILTTYFPDQYLSIYADDYLNDILRYFSLDDRNSFDEAPIYKQLRLIAFKNNDEVMRAWSLTVFAMFINNELTLYYYPKTASPKKKNRVPKFPELALVNPIVLSNDIDEEYLPKEKKLPKTHTKKKLNYVKRSIRAKAIGDRGELIVKIFEQARLIRANRPDLAERVDWLSERTDGLGYDIDSFEVDGTPKQIEVKSTVRQPGLAQFFMTDFELSVCKSMPNYCIYCVFNILSEKPYLWGIKQPFHPLKDGIVISSVVYSIEISPKQ